MSKRNGVKGGRPRGRRNLADLMEAGFFRALCDPTRIAILSRLARSAEPCSVSRIARCCPVSTSVVSRHLALLREAGVIAARKCGRQVFCSVRFSELSSTLRAMADAIDACCPTKDVVVRRKKGSR